MVREVCESAKSDVNILKRLLKAFMKVRAFLFAVREKMEGIREVANGEVIRWWGHLLNISRHDAKPILAVVLT